MIDLPLEDNTLAQDVLIENALDEYQQGFDFFLQYLLELNVNIYITERFLRFPWDLLFGKGQENKLFFNQVVRNALQMTVLTITRLSVDTNGDFHTLLQFKNKVCKWVKPEYKQSFLDRLKNVSFEKETMLLREKARQLRHAQIAHFRRSFAQEVFNQTTPQYLLQFEDIKKLRDKLNDLLQALAFGIYYGKLPWSYDVQHADVEDILDRLARTSDLLNMPERYPSQWEMFRPNLSETEIAILNKYREKFHLHPV